MPDPFLKLAYRKYFARKNKAENGLSQYIDIIVFFCCDSTWSQWGGRCLQVVLCAYSSTPEKRKKITRGLTVNSAARSQEPE
jgi:hypothetical protein